MRRFAAHGVATLAVLASALMLVSGSALAAGAPTVATGAASRVTNTTATVAGTVNPQGQATSYSFQYGLTTNYGQNTANRSAGSGTSNSAVNANLTGLSTGSTYHYRVIATNASGTQVGADERLTTTGPPPPPSAAPTATTGSASTTANSATLNGSVNPNGVTSSYYFEYGPTANYGSQTPPQNAGSGSGSVSVSASVSGLTQGTTYHYRLVAVGPGSAVNTGNDATFAFGETSLSFFGQDAFADQHGVGAVFLGCFGSVPCTGTSVTLSRSGKTLGTRGNFTIKPNSGGFVHFGLNTLGLSLLKSRGSLRLNVVADPTTGPNVSSIVTLQQFTAKG
jgi:hypothetical protein